MKKSCLICVLLLIILIISTFSSCAEKNNKEDSSLKILKTSAYNIVDNDGNIVSLRGVNAGGYFLSESWMCPTNAECQRDAVDTLYQRFGDKAENLFNAYMDSWWVESDFINIKNLNMNTIRLPFWWYNLTDENGVFKDNAFNRMDSFINTAEKYGLYVILDMHGAYGSQNGRDHSGDGFSIGNLYGNKSNEQKTVDLWVNIANRYKNNPAVCGYDLLNEPENHRDEIMTGSTPQWAFYDRLYRAIREMDKNHIIIMEGVWEINSLPSPSLYGWENVMYEYHFYNWNGQNDLNKEKQYLNLKKINWESADFGVPMLVGEFTHFNLSEAWENALSVYNENGWNWTTWTYKVTGDSSWGIYDIHNADNMNVDIYNDSYDIILNKWSSLQTSNFTKNEWLAEILSRYAEDK